jgi:D-alanyl-D-alanine dipeptidase
MIHYPELDKETVFDKYIARRSAHTRGAAVDLTLVDASTYLELDMGSIFDFMGPRSHTMDESLLTAAQRENRLALRSAMIECGFDPYPYECWHFSLKKEPYPENYFDFPVR